MACYSPMLMHVVDISQLDMNLIYSLKRVGYKTNTETMKAYRLVSKESRKLPLENIPDYVSNQVIEVPCNNCLGCRLDYSKDWANRCSLEAEEHQFNYFITLTYDDDHVPRCSIGNATLKKEHVQQFIKSLNLKLNRHGFPSCRYLLAGEYGDQTFRSHYHAILFNCYIPDLTIDFVDSDGQVYHLKNEMTGGWYKFSQFVKDCWPHGNICIDDANWNTEAYVSRYIVKKQKGKGSEVYKKMDVVPPFLLMSLKPGIGALAYEKYKLEYLDNPVLITGRPTKEPLVSGLPRYFKKLIKRDHPEVYESTVQKAIDRMNCKRSCLKGVITINRNREATENNILSKAAIFNREV